MPSPEDENRPPRRLSHALSVAVVAVFGVFLLSIGATAALLLEQNSSFRRIFEADFGQAMEAADLVREAETLNGQILERALSIQRNDSELSLLEVPEIAIFRDRVAALRGELAGASAPADFIEKLIGPYLAGISALDQQLQLERDLLNQRAMLVDDLIQANLSLQKQNGWPAPVTEKALALLSQSSALLVVNGPGQGRRLRLRIEELRQSLRHDLRPLPTGAEVLAMLEDITGRTLDLQQALNDTQQRALAMLRSVRTSAQQINGATFGDYQDRRTNTLAAMARHSGKASTTLVLMLVLAVFSTVLTIGLMSFIARRITRRLDALNKAMTDHVQGLRPDIPIDGDDELAHMGRAFSVFVHARDRAEADLALIAVTDALSGLGNRRGFDLHLENEWRRCARDQMPLTLIMADIDHFKLYNDRYGHPQGDECIRRVGGVFGRVLHRPGDFAGRYGGEEFVCILPATDHEGALSIAQAIRHDMAQLNIVHQAAPENGGRITLSIGVVTLIPTEDTNPQYLVDLADAALYQAKKSGRDRVCGSDIAAVNVESA